MAIRCLRLMRCCLLRLKHKRCLKLVLAVLKILLVSLNSLMVLRIDLTHRYKLNSLLGLRKVLVLCLKGLKAELLGLILLVLFVSLLLLLESLGNLIKKGILKV